MIQSYLSSTAVVEGDATRQKEESMSGTSILRRIGTRINSISSRKPVASILVATVIAGALLGGHQDAALASVTYPNHSVSVSCIGSVKVTRVEAFGYYDQEYVYWQGWLQRRNGSAWQTLSPSTGWKGFYTNRQRLASDFPGGLFIPAPAEWLPPSGYYRVASLFYWTKAGQYSPWEYSPWCKV